MTEILLIAGPVVAVVFLVVVVIEGALRRGYDPTYHMVSELSLGERGWIQVANFLQLGLGMLAFAVGVNRALNVPPPEQFCWRSSGSQWSPRVCSAWTRCAAIRPEPQAVRRIR